MKLSFAIPRDLDNVSLEEFEKYISGVKEMGYVAVELLINDPANVDVEGIRRVLDQYDMRISGLRSGSIYGKNGWRLSSPDVKNRSNAIQKLKDVIVLAFKFHTNVMVGLIQGHLEPGESLEHAEALIVDALRDCSEFAGDYHVTILYEAVNRFELEYHNTTKEMLMMLNKINQGISHRVELLADVYHMHLEDPSIPSALICSMPYIGHVHFADSNRCAPGAGCIDFVEVIKDLWAMNYDGYIAIEVNPIPSILGSAKRSIDYLKPIMEILQN